MQMNKFLPATIAVWVWLLIFDNFLSGLLLGSTFAQIPGVQAEFSKVWETVGDLALALVLVWMYDRVKGAFGAGLKGGATYGLYAGLVMNFPTWLWPVLYFGWPYGPAWVLVIVFTLLVVVSGAVIGMVYEKMGGQAA
jgi:hypothetical protein